MKYLITLVAFVFIQACSHAPVEPVPRAKDVNLDLFMGDWYVIANIPTFIEKGAHNAVESYAMNEDGTISTTFRFNRDSFDGELNIYRPKGYVSEENTSEWEMQFIWPFKAEYIIAYLSDDYQHTIIARTARDYVWIMARTQVINEDVLTELVQRCVDMGYARELIQIVPHQEDLINSRYNESGD